jgi:hypothetical protein
MINIARASAMDQKNRNDSNIRSVVKLNTPDACRVPVWDNGDVLERTSVWETFFRHSFSFLHLPCIYIGAHLDLRHMVIFFTHKQFLTTYDGALKGLICAVDALTMAWNDEKNGAMISFCYAVLTRSYSNKLYKVCSVSWWMTFYTNKTQHTATERDEVTRIPKSFLMDRAEDRLVGGIRIGRYGAIHVHVLEIILDVPMMYRSTVQT